MNSENIGIRSNNTATFALSKDLNTPLRLKVCNLQTSNVAEVCKLLATMSEKYSNPMVFQKLSNISINSELYATVQVLDGSNNPKTIPLQTPYKSFSGNRREWNVQLELPIAYNQLPIDSYLQIILYEICGAEPVVFGIGRISLFNREDSTLKRGTQRVDIKTNLENPQFELEDDFQGQLSGQKNIIKLLENEEVPRMHWLDKIVLGNLEKERNKRIRTLDGIKDGDKGVTYDLFLEFPKFDLPIVFSDTSYTVWNAFLAPKEVETKELGSTNVILNLVDIPMSKKSPLAKVYDPDLQATKKWPSTFLVGSTIPQNFVPHAMNYDPIELKYHKLERNLNNNSILDKDLKPTPLQRDELIKILQKPTNMEISDFEKNLIWKFRYFFSKNKLINAGTHDDTKSTKVSTRSTNLFLTKFLKSINWDSDSELDHVFNEIIPIYWSVDKIHISDALELLSNFFNPLTLTSQYSGKTESHFPEYDSNQEHDRLNKIIEYVVFLRKFAVDRLQLASADEILLYLLQLVQALKHESIIFDRFSDLDNFGESNDSNILSKSPLATFLIEKAVENEYVGNFFYWYIKVENEDLMKSPHFEQKKIYSWVLNKFIERLKSYSEVHRKPSYDHLKKQIWLIKKLTHLVEVLRTSFKKNEATVKKIQFLRSYLANSANEFLDFREQFPLPLDPSVMICGCYPEESSVFKSSLAPLKITFKTSTRKLVQQGPTQLFSKNTSIYGKYPVMFKIGDDLRQDQLVIQILNLMDRLLKNENLDLKLTPYRILATSPVAGMIQFVPNETLDAVLSKSYNMPVPEGTIKNNNGTSDPGQMTTVDSSNGILNYLKLHSQDLSTAEPETLAYDNSTTNVVYNDPKNIISSDLGVSKTVMNNYVKSCAGYCVITYILGVGDRHLDNLLLSPDGRFWHADFGYILGRDPKPFPPLMKLPIQVIDGMGGLNHENFSIFKNYCFMTYITLRKNSNLILNLFQLMLEANIPDIKVDPTRAVEKVQEKFALEMSEEDAILHFQNLINDSVNAFLPVVIDRLHSLAQYWRA